MSDKELTVFFIFHDLWFVESVIKEIVSFVSKDEYMFVVSEVILKVN